jgi:hypothetical protein
VKIFLLVSLFTILGWAVAHLICGLSKIMVYRGEIRAAFLRDCQPFKPNQFWLVLLLMMLTWPMINWEEEVHYYKEGLPEWRRPRSS